MTTETDNRPPFLQRTLGVFGAVMMGLGAMIGTGVFVSIGVAAGVAGPHVVWAIVIAAGVAVCNALSSAQLAAAHPVSGGTYEYGYTYLTPRLGFTAGWMFLCAKSASAATAALGFSGYLLHLLSLESPPPLILPAVLTAAGVTLLVTGGMKRTHWVNVAIVSVTLLSLLLFVVFALPPALAGGNGFFTGQFNGPGFLQGCALMFVAYTGYGRIATLGEEVKSPRETIPLAIILAMGVSALLYISVGVAAIGAVGAETLGELTTREAAPLESVLNLLGRPAVARVVALGAMTAMLGVFLNLILGLSRVLLAMGRRGDAPVFFARVGNGNPRAAVLGVGVLVTGLVLIGDVRLTWSFSAFTVLVYYAITNLSALRLPPPDRLYPKWISALGL